ncbi:MAG: hypothetical protein HKO57_17960, partial [Akkermansiaceae bacterium]|nr:hypothetical protein [Akkermansiaceae bacterium]
AWVTCLWALTEWRDWARRLASPVLLPLAARICHLVSDNRLTISQALRLKGDAALAEEVALVAGGREGRAP